MRVHPLKVISTAKPTQKGFVTNVGRPLIGPSFKEGPASSKYNGIHATKESKYYAIFNVILFQVRKVFTNPVSTSTYIEISSIENLKKVNHSNFIGSIVIPEKINIFSSILKII